jgi:tetratricopeptide (TPR) repeat protein
VKPAKRAVQRRPLDVGYWEVLGKAQFGAGKWQDSIESLKKAIELRPDSRKNESLLLRLSIAHWQLGHKDEARTWYDNAVKSMDKDNKNEDLVRLRAEVAELFGMPASQSSIDQPASQDNNSNAENAGGKSGGA